MNPIQFYEYGKKRALEVVPDSDFYIDISNPLSYTGDPINITDLSVNNRQLVMKNSPVYNTKGFVFDGINDYAESTYSDIRFSAGLTVEVYILFPNIPSGYKEILCIQNNFSPAGIRIQLNSSSIQLTVGEVNDYTANIYIQANTKMHLVFTLKNNNLKSYLNGTLITSQAVGNQSATVCNNILFGTNNLSRHLNFKLFQSRIWKNELSGSLVKALYDETVVKFT